jgi:hypothetical protein
MDIDKITNLISGKPIRLGRGLIKILPNIVLAAVVILIGFILPVHSKTSSKLISKVSHNATFKQLI